MVSDAQERVAAFLDANDLHAPPANRALDLASEVGEVAKEVNASTDYGASHRDGAGAGATVAADELGDALFALLALCDETDTDAGAALATALEKYERRLEATGDAGSGE